MKYSVKFIDNFSMLKDLVDIRSRIANEFEPTQELDKYLLLVGMVDERIKKSIEIMDKEIGDDNEWKE